MVEAKARERLQLDKQEFINALGMMRGEHIYNAGLVIAVHSKVYDMIYNGEIKHDKLYDLVLKHESPIVNIISGDYVLKNHTDFNDLNNFVNNKIDEMIKVLFQ